MEEKKLKRIIVDFYAVRSVTIAAYDEEKGGKIKNGRY